MKVVFIEFNVFLLQNQVEEFILLLQLLQFYRKLKMLMSL